MLAYWNTQDSPYRDALNNAPKYVASSTLTEPLPWPNSTLLSGDIPAAVPTLKLATYRPARLGHTGQGGVPAR